MLQACQRPRTVEVRREGESLFISETQVRATQPPRRLFGKVSGEEGPGAQLRTHYRRDFDFSNVETGMLHRVVPFDDVELRHAIASLEAEGEPVLEPDLIDAATRLPHAFAVLHGTFCFLKSSPGPYLASILDVGGVLRVSWSDFRDGIVPAGTPFLVFTKP